jgi:aspartyl-tRNA(Asn)/glutamyl-tRNA(Gln) amidotransferase subunit B
VTGWETVIGLEVHVQLRTRSKLFCGCSVSHGDAPNHHTCPVCLALPGALPVVNRAAVEHAVRAGLATHCQIHSRSIYARKSYWYPDLPKGYQISQYEEPLATGGWLDIELDGEGESQRKRIGITRIHMEDDAGKSIHDDAAAGRDETLVDLNRTGVPLIEIVSEPDLRTAEEVGTYLRTLHQVLRYIDVSDADLEKGQFRCDVNVSVRRSGESGFGTRTEMKNLNSFRAAEGAVRAESLRQVELLEGGGEIQQATMRYDADSERVAVMRLKENADDYRYFPDPDLIPIDVDPARVEDERARLPELPDTRRARFTDTYGVSVYEARILAGSRRLADFFEETAALHGRADIVAKWILRDVLAALKDAGHEIEASKLAPRALSDLIALVESGSTTARSAREVLSELVARGGDPGVLVRERGLEAVSDSAALEPIVESVLAEHPDAVLKYRSGDGRALNFLMGQVMRSTGGKADAARVRELLLARLEA